MLLKLLEPDRLLSFLTFDPYTHWKAIDLESDFRQTNTVQYSKLVHFICESVFLVYNGANVSNLETMCTPISNTKNLKQKIEHEPNE